MLSIQLGDLLTIICRLRGNGVTYSYWVGLIFFIIFLKNKAHSLPSCKR